MKGKGASESMLDVENPFLKSSAYCLLLLASSRENYSEGEGVDEVRVRFLCTWFKEKKRKDFWIPFMSPAAYINKTTE